MKKKSTPLPDDVELLKKMLLEQQAKLERQLAQNRCCHLSNRIVSTGTTASGQYQSRADQRC
jgi:hypothetical protein